VSVHIVCCPISCVVETAHKVRPTEDEPGGRVCIEVDDTHPAATDPDRKMTWRLNSAQDDIEPTGQDPGAVWMDPAPTTDTQKLDRIAAAVRTMLGRPIP